MPNTPIDVQALIRALGGPRSVAREIARLTGSSITHNSLMNWQRVPAERVKTIVAIATARGHLIRGRALTPVDLRPDVF